MNIERESYFTEIRQRALPSDRVVFVSGNFNTVHPGHVRLLNFARGCGDILVVGINKDCPNILPEGLRLESIKALACVNYVFILNEPVELILADLKPHIVVKGSEFKDRDNVEVEVVRSYGGKVLFCKGGDFHPRLAPRKGMAAIDLDRIKFQSPQSFLKNHGINKENIKRIILQFSCLRILVIGDSIVDEYITCEALGLSKADPVVVVSPTGSEVFVGGAAVIAAHAAVLGAQVKYLSVIGNDPSGQYLEEALESYGIDTYLLKEEYRPTSQKTRYRAGGRTLLRVNKVLCQEIEDETSKRLREEVERIIKNIDLVVFSDFNNGCLPQSLVEGIITVCDEQGVPMVADSQSYGIKGDIGRFTGMLLITPTEDEARISIRQDDLGLVELASKLQQKTSSKNVFITLNEEGVLIHRGATGARFNDDLIPAMNSSPKDVSGAGDCMFICSSMALALGSTIWESAYIGSVAAACQAGWVGNWPIAVETLIQSIEE